MVNYKCPRCGYEINIKTKYVNHLRRKKLCNPVVSEDDLQNEYIKFNVTEKINKNLFKINSSKMTQNDSENDSSDSKMTQNDSKNMNVNIVINVFLKVLT